MIQVKIGERPYDIRIFVRSEKIVEGEVVVDQVEIPMEDLFLSRIEMVIDGESKRTLTLQTEFFTLDGVVPRQNVTFDRLARVVSAAENSTDQG